MRRSRTFRAFRALVLLVFAAYVIGPLLAMLDFSTRVPGSAPGRTWDAWANVIRNETLRTAILNSLLLALLTVALMVLLLVPTMVWTRLRVPRMTRVVEFLCLLPLTIPALVIVVGITNVYSWVWYLLGQSAWTLTFAYVVLVLPYSYRALDAALSAIDVRTLAEAARSLGASWATVIFRVVLPNITGGVLGAAFISIALVLGEYTFASLLHMDTLPVAMAVLYKSQAATSIAAALASILLVSALLLGLSFLGRRKHLQGVTR